MVHSQESKIDFDLAEIQKTLDQSLKRELGVRVRKCRIVRKRVSLKPENCSRLSVKELSNNQLGISSVIGISYDMTSLEIEIDPVEKEVFQALCPYLPNSRFSMLQDLVGELLQGSCCFGIRIRLQDGEAIESLGSTRLGFDSWLSSAGSFNKSVDL